MQQGRQPRKDFPWLPLSLLFGVALFFVIPAETKLSIQIWYHCDTFLGGERVCNNLYQRELELRNLNQYFSHLR